eukprot:TRINITY_DN33660_c0_g1_i1.p1 TRINITY_DN33660_c0_g1~~TRINITY_DN33660_c0_g1_i1.p1  ORF type:complete len:993 (+),score=244.96 TRINITY_DN33660_c0_g1_i1:43-3021(+)
MLRSRLCGLARVTTRQGRFCQATRVVKPRNEETFLNSSSLAYLEDLTERQQQGEEIEPGLSRAIADINEQPDLDMPILTSAVPRPLKESDRSATPEEIRDAIKVAQMIRAFSVRGHLMCDLDPLGLLQNGIDRSGTVPDELDPAYFGFTEEDMDRTFRVQMHEDIGGFFSKGDRMSLRQLVAKLREIYCGRIGWEFMHIPDRETTRWLRDRLELPAREEITPVVEKRKRILKDLASAELFEGFLHVKYPTKRFGLDGGDSLIPGMIAMIEKAANMGVEDVVIGMPHRGRLNVLSNVCGKPLKQILHEFEDVLPENEFGSGDVKYHLGTVQDRVMRDGKSITVSLVANPSHLEAVNPVVAGKTRAKQRYAKDHEGSKSVPILLHGDAAFSGQGICYETMGLANLYRYTCGGTIHIVVNNQIGFTTNPQDNRSSPYCTDIAKQGHPVFHVNGDDPESVVRVCEMAMEFRQKWKKDVIIDIVCYRRHGHNEKDEPMFTQPLMYKVIKNHSSVLTIYEKQLLGENVVSKGELQTVRSDIDAMLKKEYKEAKNYHPKKEDWLESRWEYYRTSTQLAFLKSTGVSVEKLKEIGVQLCKLPADFTPHSKLKSIITKNEKNITEGTNIEWGTAEALAYATLLLEGNHVRLSGQDVERGTFSHRHAVLHDFVNATTYCPLGNLHKTQAHFEVCNSSLSEYGVLGFEVGYSMENPASLVLWEAQFGDFANGAQVIFDQFLSSGEAKWVRQCGLVVLLPHGYDGQGPEHSSSRLERFLIMADEDEDVPNMDTYDRTSSDLSVSEQAIMRCNWQVAYPSTPAQYFHLLRRQVHREFRKPLICIVSKAGLRAPNTSNLDEFALDTSFSLVIDDGSKDLVAPPILVKRVALCTGQIYFKAVDERKKRGRWDVALVRVEQLAPFPFQEVADILTKYSNAEFVWLQEEPKNMGAWSHARPRVRNIVKDAGLQSGKLRYIGRAAAASPATGHLGIHNAEHKKIMDELFE